ncbi:serine protease [Sphingosinicella sp. BN140058]|uniref:trypsin-like serine peptidase n=1 Tax=Sphingosinicella sp. BN140058 TaxID=1892855 RepID=UPI001011F8C9|nr:trypsin-like peptidase domain-containing protein [Sphingosinicella sp. BN140058]QAY79351.1 trypsin-like serine protease [Sphingosinicella sp. BN140058]
MDSNDVANPDGGPAEPPIASPTEVITVEVPGAPQPDMPAPKRLRIGPSDQPITGDGPVKLESIIGLDERTQILDTQNWPWRMICALAIEGPWGNFVGTGWFVGPKTVITAGHCVYEPNAMGGWATKITLTPGASGSQEPFQSVVATRFETTDQWLNAQDPDFDMAVIHLDVALGSQVGWFGVASLPDATLQNFQVNVSGYPVDKGGRQQWWARNRIRGLTPRRVFYDVDTMGGQSGAPVFIIQSEGAAPQVVGIHAYGVGGAVPASVPQDVNSAPRIIPEVITLIKQWVAKDGSGS